ncbi:MAG TPA: hypothetical protein VMZ27_00435 [Candidatus Saccharimonadales bacterium]|nr:hypothetical protein [Candidatus Saccharimonadales bacterium]
MDLAAKRPLQKGLYPRAFFLAITLLLFLLVSTGRTAVRFDVFLGFDGIVPEGSWFPVVFEVYNDGPPFKGTVELSPGNMGQSQTRTMVVELPTGTLKRFVLPVFGTSANIYSWNARLLDEKERVRADAGMLRVRKTVQHGIPITAALTHSTRGMPIFPEVNQKQSGFQPMVARLQPNLFPDNPIGLEGLDNFYLNAERALELKVEQVKALVSWLVGGGHLIIGVEQPLHVTGNEWLRGLLPCEITGLNTMESHPGIQDWLTRYFTANDDGSASEPFPTTQPLRHRSNAANPYTNLRRDDTFEQAPLQAATCTLRDGNVLMGSATRPLAVTAKRGRGQITVLLFSPELEPFASYAHRGYFWSRLAQIPPELYSTENVNYYSNRSLDAVFGAMIDSRQVRKLPVGWLLLLLIGYLVVIGPLDQYWLKKINRQMLTWITFPAYVALFSVLIYIIGYRLRAGETEWNELHVVDVMSSGERAQFRGRTFASIYSPVNARYEVASEQPYATFRGEYMGNFGSAQEASRAVVEQKDNRFVAEISVPVWVNQLYVSDWWRIDSDPLKFQVSSQGNDWLIHLDNQIDSPVTGLVVVDNRVYTLESVARGKSQDFRRPKNSGTPLAQFINTHGSGFNTAVSQRQQAFGSTEGGHLPNNIESAAAASFVSRINTSNNGFDGGYGSFTAPHGFDLSPLARRGDAVLLAWAEKYSPVKPLNHFNSRRGQRNTMFRIAGPVQP